VEADADQLVKGHLDAKRSGTVCGRSKIYEREMLDGFLGIGGCLLETETGQKFVCDFQRHWTMMTDRISERDQREVICSCGLHLCDSHQGGELKLHAQVQDRGCQPWQSLLNQIADARKRRSEVFAPFEHMQLDDKEMIITLPAEIGQLAEVKTLVLYGSNLSSLPPEIGQMESLKEFDPYTSYQLHWFPYEITRCKKLASSRVSTRALYGNRKFRPPFPLLTGNPFVSSVTRCSVCERRSDRLDQYWISLRVGTDVLPLLAHVCSAACLERMPKVADGSAVRPHRGGIGS